MAAIFIAAALSLAMLHREMIPRLQAFQTAIDQMFPYDPLLGRASLHHFYETGSVAFVLMLFLLLAFDTVPISDKSRTARAINFISEGTFPLYLFHFPILVFIFSITGTSNTSLSLRAMILIGISIFAVLTGHPCNILKVHMRTWLLGIFRVT